jgi:hypothetical protein
MTPFIIAFLSLALLLGAFAYVAMPVGSRSRRAIVSSFFAIVLGALFFGYSDMLGRPKSSRLEVLQGGMEEARVSGSYFTEGKGIFLWLLPPGSSEPRHYELPWDQKTASALQNAIEQNEQEHGGGVMMMGPAFEHSWDRFEPKFYPLPQPKLPDKPYEAAPSQTYQGPEQGI